MRQKMTTKERLFRLTAYGTHRTLNQCLKMMAMMYKHDRQLFCEINYQAGRLNNEYALYVKGETTICEYRVEMNRIRFAIVLMIEALPDL
jgi:hypothetical protein